MTDLPQSTDSAQEVLSSKTSSASLLRIERVPSGRDPLQSRIRDSTFRETNLDGPFLRRPCHHRPRR